MLLIDFVPVCKCIIVESIILYWWFPPEWFAQCLELYSRYTLVMI